MFNWNEDYFFIEEVLNYVVLEWQGFPYWRNIIICLIDWVHLLGTPVYLVFGVMDHLYNLHTLLLGANMAITIFGWGVTTWALKTPIWWSLITYSLKLISSMSSHFGIGVRLPDNALDQGDIMCALEGCYETIKEERLK